MITIDPPSTLPIPIEAPLSKSALTRFLNRARQLAELAGEVDILITSDAELKRLNRTFRGKNKPTDILSFPAPPEISAIHAGDLAISLETAARQAAQYGHTLPEELRILILHGLLHLSGLDHETDHGEMAAREDALRTTLKLPTTLIARASNELRKPKKLGAPYLAAPSPDVGRPTNALRAKGPSHTSLGQRPRLATREQKRANGPTHRSSRKKAARS